MPSLFPSTPHFTALHHYYLTAEEMGVALPGTESTSLDPARFPLSPPRFRLIAREGEEGKRKKLCIAP